MKKVMIAGLLSLICIIGYGHDINYEKICLHTWQVNDGKLMIKGSYQMLKDGAVYIETENNKLISIPFQKLSKADQAFAMHKYRQIEKLNKQLLSTSDKAVGVESSINNKTLVVVVMLLLLVISWTFITYTNKLKRTFIIPVLIAGLFTTLVGFTTRIMKVMKTTTSPTFIDSAFVPFKSELHTSWDTTYFYVESRGIPATHTMMVGISNRGWQQQVPIPQCYTGTNAWSIPLNPVLAANPIPVDSIHFTRGAIALAVNGIPIFNVHTNTGVDSYVDGQLDNYGGHCGRADDYHYHIAPLHLYQYTSATAPIAFGLDGYAVYGSKEPDGSNMQSLDANHGHLFNGVYHYHGTSTKPYMIGRMAGQVTEDNTHQLIPQPSAKPVRPSLTPLSGALITGCIPNANNNGYCLIYTRNGVTDSVVYSWTAAGQYTFKYYTNGNLDSTKTFNGFVQCKIQGTTGLEQLMVETNEARIFPNPNNGTFSLQLSNSIHTNDIKEIAIYSLKGELIYKSNHYQSAFELISKPKGIYLLLIKIGDAQLVRKLLIN